MADKMLVTQALDERDLLVKKIQDKIKKANFVDTIKPNEEKVLDARVSREEFAKDAESAYQQIQDLIERFQKIDAAIVASNANTTINTSYGSFTVAGAISLRSRLRGAGSYDGDADFETALQLKMEKDFQTRVTVAEMKNKQLQSTAENMRLSILGKDTMGMYDTFWGKYICPGCNKEIQFEEQTKDYERCLEDFKLGDYIDRGNRNYFYDFTYECPCCGEETELSIGIRHGQYVGVYFTEEARKIDPNTLENIEDGYQRHREYEEKCRNMLGSADIEAKEEAFAPYRVGETIRALEADWEVIEAYKEEYVGYPDDEEKRELHMKLFYHPGYVYRVRNGETFRIIVIRLNSWNKAMWYEVYEDNFEQLDERARLDGTYPHRYFIQYECELKRI